MAERPLTPAYDEAQQPYDPAALFDLEFMVSIAVKSPPEYAAETWPIVFEFIAALLSSAQSYSILLIERAVTSLLKLCLLICDEVSCAFKPDSSFKARLMLVPAKIEGSTLSCS